MREYRPLISQKKLKPSKFFESFIQSKGPNGVARASSGEIQRALKSFFLDLAFGNIVQPQYIEVMRQDPRIIQEAMTEANNKMIEANTVLQSLEFSAQHGLPITGLPSFSNVHNKYLMMANTYGVILTGLRGFAQTGDESHLIAVSTKFNNVLMRGGKQQLML